MRNPVFHKEVLWKQKKNDGWWLRQIISQFLSSEGSQSRWFLSSSRYLSSDRVRVGRAVGIWQNILVSRLNLRSLSEWSSDLSEWPTQPQAWRLSVRGLLWCFSEVDITLSNFSWRGFEENGFGSQWFQVIRMGEKWKELVWRVVAKYWRKQQEFRIQFSLQVEIKSQRQWTELESNTHKYALELLLKHNFSWNGHPRFSQR